MRNVDERDLAQRGLQQIEESILLLLERHTDGLRNAQVAEYLGLRSDFNDKQKNYLTYSVLGGLLKNRKVVRDQKTKLSTKAK